MEGRESAYTCITCRVAFPDAELQRNHYKTDWHRYNLKRKVAELPPVTSENFDHRLAAQKAMFSFQEDENNLDKSSVCHTCSKHFRNKNQYENHVKSRKHIDNEKKREANKDKDESKKNEARKRTTSEGEVRDTKKVKGSKTADEEEMDTDDDDDSDGSYEEWEEGCLGIEECLFCTEVSSSFETNVKHMTDKHSFFIPDLEYIINLEDFIIYLGEKVGAGNMCLWCNEKGKAFPSTRAAQQHMVDKGHCKILYEGRSMTEFVDFYDYRSSWPDYKSEEAGAGGDDAEMKDKDEAEVKDKDKDEEEVNIFELVPEGYEMALPSGATIGHRSLMKYYKQNLPAKKKENSTKSLLPGMLAQYKALGWTGATGPVAEQRVKDLGYMQRMKNKYHQQVGVKSNKLQKHFRKQMLV